MGFKFNDDTNRVYEGHDISTKLGTGDFSRTLGNKIAIPADVRKIELWFFCKSFSGIVAFDSKFGQNYAFNVAAPAGPATRTVTTKLRNALDASVTYGNSVFPDSNDTYYYPATIALAYDALDSDRFAGVNDSMLAVVGVNLRASGRGWVSFRPTEWHEVTLTREGRRFVGNLETKAFGISGSTDVRVDTVDVAVSSQGTWDSNDGANYRVQVR